MRHSRADAFRDKPIAPLEQIFQSEERFCLTGEGESFGKRSRFRGEVGEAGMGEKMGFIKVNVGMTQGRKSQGGNGRESSCRWLKWSPV